MLVDQLVQHCMRIGFKIPEGAVEIEEDMLVLFQWVSLTKDA